MAVTTTDPVTNSNVGMRPQQVRGRISPTLMRAVPTDHARLGTLTKMVGGMHVAAKRNYSNARRTVFVNEQLPCMWR